jgi:competence protein ComEC
VNFEFLHPAPGYVALDDNNAACVLRASTAGGAVLLSGDIGHAAEKALLRRQPDKLRAELLVVPHHGSKTSSSPAFVAAVRPAYALFATGYRNRFGFPKPEVVARYRGSVILNTAESGAIRFSLSDQGVSLLELARAARGQRYWHRP